MGRKKAVATAPGQPTMYVDFTVAEEAARDAEEAQAVLEASKIHKYDKLTKAFGTMYLTRKAQGKLNKNQRLGLLETQAAVQLAKLLNDDEAIVEAITNAVLPSDVEADRQSMLDIINGPEMQDI